MKRVCIVTIADYTNLNIGNKLQNLAIQEVFKGRYNVAVKTLQTSGSNINGSNDQPKKKFVHNKLVYKIKTMLGKYFSKYKQHYKFSKFDKNISYYNWYFCKGSNNFVLDKKFDYFVTGSDQVWNPYFCKEQLSTYFLMFTTTNKKITFAPSIGSDIIPQELEQQYKNGFNSFDKIFLREETSLDLVKKYSDTDVSWVFDPTLFLSKEQWLKFSCKKPVCQGKFILCYFLGEMAELAKYEIFLFAKDRNLSVVTINYSSGLGYEYSPDEFLWLINNAQYVFTNSFHGTVFSYIFKKKFVVYNREGALNMSGRITSLANNLKLQKALRNNIKQLDLIDDIIIDYTVGQLSLEKNKARFFEYLDSKLK